MSLRYVKTQALCIERSAQLMILSVFHWYKDTLFGSYLLYTVTIPCLKY